MKIEKARKYPLESGESRAVKWKAALPVLYAIGSTSLLGLFVTNFLSIYAEQLDALSAMAIITLVYSLGVSCSAPIGGYLGDVYGRRNMALISIVMLICGVVITAMAESIPAFLVGLVVWGVANGLDETFYNGLLCDMFSDGDRTFFLSVANSFNSGSIVIGSIAMGYLMEIISPNAVMLIAACAIVIGWICLYAFCPNIKSAPKSHSFDWKGCSLLLLSLSSFCIFLNAAGKYIEWVSWQSCALLAVGIVSCLSFLKEEESADRPLIDLKLFKIRCFVPVIILMGINKLQGPIITYSMTYANVVLNYSTVQLGYTQLLTLIAVVLSPLIGKWLVRTNKFRQSFLISGVLLVVQGLAMFFFLTPETSFPVFLCLRGIGYLSTVFVAGPSIAYISIIAPKGKQGMSLGLYTTLTYLFNTFFGSAGGLIYNMHGSDVAVAFPRIAFICSVAALCSIMVSMLFVKEPAKVKA